MALAMLALEGARFRKDNASLSIEGTPRADLAKGTEESWNYGIVLARLLEEIGIKKQRFESSHVASRAELFIDGDVPVNQSVTTAVDFDVRLSYVREALVDDFIPRLPLMVQPIRMKLRIGGRGRPTFKTTEAEVSLNIVSI